MLDSKRIYDLVRKLKAGDRASRDRAASEIADWIEANQLRDDEFNTVVGALMDTALLEKDTVVKEGMFNALSSAGTSPQARAIDWDPIAASLEELDAVCLEHALVILGFSRSPKYRTRIEKYLGSSDETVRLTAAEALALLDAGQRKICHG
jgi:hypothetical protein